MTPLGHALCRRIAATGPMTLADYMAACLLDPRHGYYATRDPFGAAGDFITAPEMSQMFGELLGLALAARWFDQGRPAPFTLAELGPGRGTLMADLLRATRGVPGFHAAARIQLVEASPTLREVQRARLAPFPVAWADGVEELADGPLFLVANEFFDALPIRQFLREENGWAETMVGLSGAETLALGRRPALLPDELFAHRHAAPGTLLEYRPAAAAIMAAIGRRIAHHGGLALIVDYGAWEGQGDTFQAVMQHHFADPLAAPGMADLTAHVAFDALARAARPAASSFGSQRAFLLAHGLAERSRRLAANLSGAQLDDHLAAAHRLTDAAEMGTLFKVLAIHPPGTPPLPGLALRNAAA